MSATDIGRLGLIVVAVFSVYSNALTGPFLFDDVYSIVNNATIRVVLPFSQSLWGPQDTPTAGRPVVNLSFALNYAMGRFNVVGYHIVNVVLHVLNAILLFLLIRRTLTRPPWDARWNQWASGVASIAAALWALHPLQTETVNYITQRSELLMAFFFLATLYSANLGTVIARRGEYQEASVWFERSIRLDPTLSDPFYNLGNCYALLDRDDEAIIAYKRCVALKSSDVAAWFKLGKCYIRVGQTEDARQCFEKVLQIQPDAIEAQYELQQLGLK